MNKIIFTDGLETEARDADLSLLSHLARHRVWYSCAIINHK